MMRRRRSALACQERIWLLVLLPFPIAAALKIGFRESCGRDVFLFVFRDSFD